MSWSNLGDNDFPTKKDVAEVIGSFSRGMIIAFSGSSIPNGWAICDGNNGTPNLVGKFIRGGSSAGATGGSDSVTLSVNNMPRHSHAPGNLKTTSDGSHTHTYTRPKAGKSDNASDRNVMEFSETGTTGAAGTHSHNLTGNTGETGNGESFSILPSFYTLIYIMKL